VAPVLQTSNPAAISQSAGGVGRNVAVAAHYAGAKVALASAVADDIAGQSLLGQMRENGFATDYIATLASTGGARTAQYVAVNDGKKDLVLAMADMNILARPELEYKSYWDEMLQSSKPKWVVVDGNWSAKIMSAIVSAARANNIPVAYEPVSTAKAITLFDRSSPSVAPKDCVPAHVLNLATPNQFELQALHTAAREQGYFDSPEWWAVIDSFGLTSSTTREKFTAITSAELVNQGIPQQCMQLLPYIPNIITKLGSQGCLLTQIIPDNDPRLRHPNHSQYMISRCLDSKVADIGGVYMRLFPPAARVPAEDVVSVNGIGDTMLGTIMAALSKGHTLEEAIPVAQEASVFSLKSAEAVSPEVKSIAGRLGKR
jgi:pseudouridylate synthase / pseudouridine kinase